LKSDLQSEVVLRFSKNKDYFAGKTETPYIGGTSPVYEWIGIAVMACVLLAMIGLVGVSAWQLRYLDAVFGAPPEREKFELFMFVICMLFLGGLGLAGWIMRSTQQRLKKIDDLATHVCSGKVERQIRSKGHVIVCYTFTSPETQQELRGTSQVGNLESVRGQLVAGAPVALLYATDKLHVLL
jgi:hypothetical protein